MGQKNSAPRTLETYTSFEVLPTEYFNRLNYQNMYSQQVQQQQVQQQQVQQMQMQPQLFQQYNYPAAQPVQQYFVTPIAQAVQKVVEYTVPQNYQLYGQAPMIPANQNPVQIQQQAEMDKPSFYSNASSSNLGSSGKRASRHGFDQAPAQQEMPINASYLNAASRRSFGLAPSSSQPIRSVPKFSANRSFAYWSVLGVLAKRIKYQPTNDTEQIFFNC